MIRKTYYWIKLYHELLFNPRMGKLDDHTWRRAIELFLIAGYHHQEGALPPLDDIAWNLHTTPDDIRQVLLKLEELNVASSIDRENWVIVNFARRQAAVTSAERSRGYRLRRKAVKEDLPVPGS